MSEKFLGTINILQQGYVTFTLLLKKVSFSLLLFAFRPWCGNREYEIKKCHTHTYTYQCKNFCKDLNFCSLDPHQTTTAGIGTIIKCIPTLRGKNFEGRECPFLLPSSSCNGQFQNTFSALVEFSFYLGPWHLF